MSQHVMKRTANGGTPAWNIRRWLLKYPRPAKVVAHQAGQAQELRIHGLPWARIGETIADMAPDRVEVFDGAGRLVRTMRRGDIYLRQPEPEPPKLKRYHARVLRGEVPDPSERLTPEPPLMHCPFCHSPLTGSDLLTLLEVAEMARVSLGTVRHWVRTGKLLSVKPGKMRMVPRAAFAELLRASG